MLGTLKSKWCNNPVGLSRDRDGEDVNLAQNAASEICNFANQEATCSSKMNDLFEMDYLINQYLSGSDFKSKKFDPT